MGDPTESSEAREIDRRRRLALIGQFADEVATWPSSKLRMANAQPETVRRAEERERLEAERRETPS